MRSLSTHGFIPLLTAILLAGHGTVHAEDAWPHWRGPNHDGTATTSKALHLGPESALAIAWEQPLGSGYSGISIADGRVVTMFADAGQDWVGAFDAATGTPLWRYRVDSTYIGHDGSHDGPLSTPAILGDRVVALGARGQLVCLASNTGEQLWSVDLAKAHGIEAPVYGFSSSPVVHQDLVIVGTGTAAKAPTLSAFDLGTGEPRWHAGSDLLPNQTPILVSRPGGVELIAAARHRLSAWDPSSGRVIWQLEHGGHGADASVVPIGDQQVVFSSSWPETMSATFRWALGESDQQGVPAVSVSWRTKGLGKSYNTPVSYRDQIFGYAGSFLTSLDANTGERLWKSRAPGAGFLILVDNHLVTLTRTGELHLGSASPEGYRSSASLRVLDTASWTGPSFAQDLIFVRGFAELVAVRITGAQPPVATQRPEGRVAGSLMARLVDQVAAAEDKAGTVDRFLKQHDHYPIVEGNDLVHIVYRGGGQDVALMGDMFFGAPWYFVKEQRPLHRVPGTGLFYYTLQLEPDARVNYQLSVDFANPTPDPLNPTTVEVDRVGKMSLLKMPRWQPADGSAKVATRPGRIDEHTLHSGILGRDLTLKVYLPAGYNENGHPYPTLYFSDAKLALERGELATTLDARSAAGAPAIAVLVIGTDWGDHLGGRRDAYTEALVREIVPLIDDRYRTVNGPDGRAAVGCGEGGVVSLLAALAYPGVFSQVGSLSAYAVPDLSTQIQALARDSRSADLTVYLEWGKYDLRTGEGNLDIPAENRHLAAALAAEGFTVATREVPEGFGWATWRHRVIRLLESLDAAAD